MMLGGRPKITLADSVQLQREVLDLEGFIIVEEDIGGPSLAFKFGEHVESFLRTGNLPPNLLRGVVDIVTAKPTVWSFSWDRVGVRVFGESPQRTLPNFHRPTMVLRSGVRDWAILVVNGTSELAVRTEALPSLLRRQVRDTVC